MANDIRGLCKFEGCTKQQKSLGIRKSTGKQKFHDYCQYHRRAKNREGGGIHESS